MPVYLVSGYMRSGTSMMMAALEAGGLPLAWSEKREASARRRFNAGEYVANGRFLELSQAALMAPDFATRFAGRAAKCLRWTVLTLPAGDYRVLFMRRNGEEVRQSLQALLDRRLPPAMADEVEIEANHIAGVLRQRRDVAMLEVPYRDAVAAPVLWFERIAAAGWPIDPAKAAAVVDPSLCRYRREALDEAA